MISTVAHALHPENDPVAYAVEVADGRELEVEGRFFAQNPAHDVTFLIAKPIADFAPIAFDRPSRETVLPKMLYNARNIIGSGSRIYLAVQKGDLQVLSEIVMAPPWMEAMNSGNQQPKVFTPDAEQEIRELEERGWSKLAYMLLYSRPGFSGSPIWDDRWNLYGMGVRGNKSNSDPRPEESELLAYYPASTVDMFWTAISDVNRL